MTISIDDIVFLLKGADEKLVALRGTSPDYLGEFCILSKAADEELVAIRVQAIEKIDQFGLLVQTADALVAGVRPVICPLPPFSISGTFVHDTIGTVTWDANTEPDADIVCASTGLSGKPFRYKYTGNYSADNGAYDGGIIIITQTTIGGGESWTAQIFESPTPNKHVIYEGPSFFASLPRVFDASGSYAFLGSDDAQINSGSATGVNL